ncbi:hypothetical protein M1583_02645, partial [Candidatus Marsarchaeota archaeon]|nr:hypothetical protein [Candidatus Marsarchaeota archaeon]
MPKSTAAEERKKSADNLVERAGFASVRIKNFHAPFDIIAKKNERSLILKVVGNIDSVTPEDGAALSKLGYFFDAEVYIVGESYKGKKVEDYKIFTRHSASCITKNTMEAILYNNSFKKARKFFSECVEI